MSATDDEAPGWDSIDAAFRRVYKAEPLHVAPPVNQQPPFAGGILNGISAYRGASHWHFVTYGLTDLFHKTVGDDAGISGWGYELTLTTAALDDSPPQWAFALLMGISRTTVQDGERYEPGIRLGTGPIPDEASPLVAVAFTLDDLAQPTQFPFGEYAFLRAFGITQAERDEMKRTDTARVLDRLRDIDPVLLTEPTRPSV
ncbi:MAG: suppressor of fused domain protein [Solirubrobacteraceae bacterium]